MQGARTRLLAVGVLACVASFVVGPIFGYVGPTFRSGPGVARPEGRAYVQPALAKRPLVLVAELDGIIHPVSAEFVTDAIDRADRDGAALVVFVLRTPGGLLDSTRAIVARMMTSRAPVAVLVAPAGARAASAGFILVIAADIAAMAPGTHIGAAHPVSGDGAAMDETTSKKAAADVAAYARSLAETRGRNVSLSAEAVTESRAFTDREAMAARPPLVDFVAADVSDLIRQLNGKTVTRFDGRSETLAIAGAEEQHLAMTRRQRFLSAIAHPQIAAILLTLGILGLTVELWNPGAIAPGVFGGLSLLLAFFAFQVIPLNATGLLLLGFGIALLVLELKVPSFGALGVGGTLSLIVGAIMVTRDVPGVRVSYGVVLPVAIAFAAIFLFLGRLALQSRKMPVVTGVEGLIQARGEALAAISPAHPGQVRVHGEIWQATSDTPIDAGAVVRVTGVDGLTLIVETLPAR
jgi:membrane-bound serine protease (ClpP class)